MYTLQNRKYEESQWCVYEFREGLVHANLSGRIKFLIPIIFDKCQFGVGSKDLRFYLENHTYIEHDNNNVVKSSFHP